MLLLFNSFLAYFVNLTNFLVTKYTSALTLQVRTLSSGGGGCVAGAHHVNAPLAAGCTMVALWLHYGCTPWRGRQAIHC